MKGNLVSDLDIWCFYHNAFYQPGILNPFLFRRMPQATPVYEVTTNYEPFPVIVFSSLLAFFGERRFPFHLWGLFLHFGNTILLYRLSKKLTEKTCIGLLASGIFLFYPTNFKVVSDLSRSFEHPMVALFGSISISSFFDFLKTKRRFSYQKSLLSFLCASFTKVSAIVFIPTTIVFLDIFLFGRILRELRNYRVERLFHWLEKYSPFILCSLLFAGITTWLYPWGGISHIWGGAVFGVFSLMRILEFVTWLSFPSYVSLGEPEILVYLAFLLFLTMTIWGNNLVRFLILWIVMTFSLFSFQNFRPLGELYKYIYMATLPFSLLSSYIISLAIQKAKVSLLHFRVT